MASKEKRPAPSAADFDSQLRAQLGQMTSGLAPTAFTAFR